MQTCFIHELGRSPGGWDGNPLQYSYPENFMERGAWQVYSPWGHKDLDLTEWLTLLKTSLVVQWLRLHASTAGETGYIPGWGTKIPYASWCNNKKIKFDILGFPGGSDSEESACNVGDLGSIRKIPWRREDPLEKGMAIHSSILSWRIPWTEEPGVLQFIGSQRVWQDWVTNTFTDEYGGWDKTL